MHTSYFLFVMVITMFCYAVIKGRPSKLRQSNPEFCPEKVSGGWGLAQDCSGGLWVKSQLVLFPLTVGESFSLGKLVPVYQQPFAPQPITWCCIFNHIPIFGGKKPFSHPHWRDFPGSSGWDSVLPVFWSGN